MDNFYDKLKKYILKNQKECPIEFAPHFKYDDTTIISPEIANQIYSLYEQLITIRGLWEKEKDYSRLLKNENTQLMEELEYIYSEDEDVIESNNNINNISNDGNKEYLS